jgi:hypothetical protein
MPPEYVFEMRSAASVSPNRSNSSPARLLATLRRRPLSSPTITRFWRPVRASSRVASWAATPMLARTRAASATTSYPATRAVPESGWARVVRMRTAVVLPAPFGPRTPRMEPAGTERSIPASACVGP